MEPLSRISNRKKYFILCALLALPISGIIAQYDPSVTATPTDFFNQERSEHILLKLAQKEVNTNRVFFKAILTSNSPSFVGEYSKVMRVVLIDDKGEVLKKQHHKIVGQEVNGNVALPKRMAPGTYSIRAYTKWMKNFGEDNYTQENFSFKSKMNKVLNETQIGIEGGQLVNDILTKVAVRIPEDFKSNDAADNIITDSANTTITKLSKYSSTVYGAHMSPKANEQYFVSLHNGERIALPTVLKSGYSISVNNRDPQKTIVRINTTLNNVHNPVLLKGSYLGTIIFQNDISFNTEGTATIQLEKNRFPKGIIDLELCKEDDQKISFRPIHNDSGFTAVEFSQEQSPFGEAVLAMKLNTKIFQNNIKSAAVSVRKINSEDEGAVPYEEISNTTNSNRRFLKDLEILAATQATHKHSSDDFTTDNKSFVKEIGLGLKAYAFDLNNTLLRNTSIQVMASKVDSPLWIQEYQTDNNGILDIKDIPLEGTVSIIFRTEANETKSRLVKIEPIKEDSFISSPLSQKEVSKITSLSQKKKDTTAPFLDTESLVLNEVLLRAKNKNDKKDRPSVYGIDVDKFRTKYQDPNNPKTLPQLLMEIPGVQVVGEDFNATVTIFRGIGRPLFVVDGFPLAHASGEAGSAFGGPAPSPLNNVLDILIPSDIERIELLVGPDAAVYGSRGAGGVLLFYTKTGKSPYISRKEGQYLFNGYAPTLDFSTYREQLSKRNKRNTNLLYWNPQIDLDLKGEAKLDIPELTKGTKVAIETLIIGLDGCTQHITKVVTIK
jgi:hypothetical protein